jgi:20S proteasome subunit alpha 3
VEFATMTLNPLTKLPRAKIYRPADIDQLLTKLGLAKKDDDTEMKTA